MDILLQSDGQLYPPRHAGQKTPPKPKPKPELPEPPAVPVPKTPCPVQERAIPWEEILIVAIAFIVFKSNDKPDIPLLLALAYILFDQQFSLNDLLKPLS